MLQPAARFLFAPIDKRDRKHQHITVALLSILTLFALWLRLSGLLPYHFSGDDCLHIELALQPTVGLLLSDLWRQDAHPPLYYLILHYFLIFVPLSAPIVAKLPALLFGVAIVPASYLLGQTLCGTRAPGFLLAILTTLSGHLVLQSQTVRHYTLHVLLQIVLLIAFFDARRRRRAPYFVSAALLVCTHFVAAICVFATGIAGLIFDLRAREPKARIVSWLAAHALLAAIFLAVLLPTQSVLHLRPDGVTSYLGQATLLERGGALSELQYALSDVHLSLDGLWPWLLLLPLSLGTVQLVRRRAFELLIVAYLPIIAALILSLLGTYPIGQGRWCLWLIPGVLPIFAAAIQDLQTRHGTAAGLLFLVTFVVAIGVNLGTSHGHSVLAPDVWRQISQASHVPPTRADHTQLLRTIAALDGPHSLVFAPIAERKRVRVDLRLKWAPSTFAPNLSSCSDFAWEGFTPAQMQSCASGLLSYPSLARYERAWFINLPPRGQLETLRAQFSTQPCLPIATTRTGGAFLLVAVDLQALRSLGQCPK